MLDITYDVDRLTRLIQQAQAQSETVSPIEAIAQRAVVAEYERRLRLSYTVPAIIE
jgi:hypothetical protein